MDRHQAMRLHKGHRITFSEAGHPDVFGTNATRERSSRPRPDVHLNRKGGGILVDVDTRLEEWVPFFRVVKVTRPKPAIQPPDVGPLDLGLHH